MKIMKLDRTTFESMVREALNGDDKDKANDVRTRIIKALVSDDMIYAVYTRAWLRGEIDHADQEYDGECNVTMWHLAKNIKDSDLSLTYKYVLYNDSSDCCDYVEADTYSNLYRYGDIRYGFLGMYCNLLEKYNSTFNEGLEELGLN